MAEFEMQDFSFNYDNYEFDEEIRRPSLQEEIETSLMVDKLYDHLEEDPIQKNYNEFKKDGVILFILIRMVKKLF